MNTPHYKYDNGFTLSPSTAMLIFGIPLFAVGHYRSSSYSFERNHCYSYENVLSILFQYIYVGKSFELSLSFILFSLAFTRMTLNILKTQTNFLEDTKKSQNIYDEDDYNPRTWIHEKQIIQQASFSPEIIWNELEHLFVSSPSITNKELEQKFSFAFFCLDALSKQYCKYNKRQQKVQSNQRQIQEREKANELDDENHINGELLDYICLKSSHLVLQHIYHFYNNDSGTTNSTTSSSTNSNPKKNHDRLISEAISLLALIAKKPKIRQLYANSHYNKEDPNHDKNSLFNFDVIIHAINQSLSQTQQQQGYQRDTVTSDKTENNYENKKKQKEYAAAELQRKACLFLGAVADNDIDMSTLVVNKSGLQVILHALDWFRYHEEVANWGLWAIFVLCYEHTLNKGKLVNLDGVRIICSTMKLNPDSLEVQRHGTAILFDLLREGARCEEDNTGKDCFLQVRKLTLNAGIHDVLHQAMTKHRTSMEIMMMGREMLMATQFKGNIPAFDGALIPT